MLVVQESLENQTWKLGLTKGKFNSEEQCQVHPREQPVRTALAASLRGTSLLPAGPVCAP